VKFVCGSRVGLATLAAAERRYAFCVGLGVLVGNGWVENAAGIGGRRQSRWRSLLPAALLSLNFFFGSPDIDSETGATFFFVLKGPTQTWIPGLRSINASGLWKSRSIAQRLFARIPPRAVSIPGFARLDCSTWCAP